MHTKECDNASRMLALAYKERDQQEIERWTKALRQAETTCPACQPAPSPGR